MKGSAGDGIGGEREALRVLSMDSATSVHDKKLVNIAIRTPGSLTKAESADISLVFREMWDTNSQFIRGT